MSYLDKIDKAQKKSYNHSFATKIRDMMQNLRLSSNIYSARRWIWELLQNAKDVSNDGMGIKASINLCLEKQVLEFRHNGRPFTSENMTFLIEQISTKDQRSSLKGISKETGKFGTGFLTTHLLSEIVTIDGVLKESDEPHKKFHITLDRSGRDIDSIIEAAEVSLEQLRNVESTPDMTEYFPEEYNTLFTYKLNQKGISVAEQGIIDLKNSISYTLIFMPEIQHVSIEHGKITYMLCDKTTKIAKNTLLYTVIECEGNIEKKHTIIVSSKDDVSIATQVEIDGARISVKEFSKSTAKLFCGFPLIGTNEFPVPFIINSTNFNPTEPRNGVFLTDSDDEIVTENKSIMATAFELYDDLLVFAADNNWGNMHLFASRINSSMDVDWLWNPWMHRAITNPIKDKLLHTRIVDTLTGTRVAINDENNNFNIGFPTHKDLNIRFGIWELCKYIIPEKLPLKVDVEKWNTVLWSECKKLNLDSLANMIQGLGTLDAVRLRLDYSCDVVEWMNTYYKLLNQEKEFIENIIGDKYSIIPNQNGIFKKHSELRFDNNIEEELKNALFLLTEDCRAYLVDRSISTGDGIKYNFIDSKMIINKINERLADSEPTAINAASYYLITLFSEATDFPIERETIYQYCKAVFPSHVGERRKIEKWSKQIWERADKIVIENLALEISSYENVAELALKLDTRGFNKPLEWMNTLVSYLEKNDYDYLLNDENNPILPNQNGVFCIKDNLFLDDDTVDEELKEISARLGFDFRDELLSKDIFLNLPPSRTKTIKDISEKISSMIRGKWSDLLKVEETRPTLKALLVWFNENEEKAKEYFSDLYKNKHRLLDDAEIIESMDKACKYDEIMDRYNIGDHHKLEQLLEAASTSVSRTSVEKQILSEDILAQLGICSSEELENAFKDGLFADRFVHVSDRNAFKFQYVQGIIERAIKNVFEHLGNRPEYNLLDKEEVAKTIFSVTKNSEDIYIMVRPSDFDQIIIYYDSEKDLLDYEKDCELWIDDGVHTPQKITFGKILKITGINRIPLKRIV